MKPKVVKRWHVVADAGRAAAYVREARGSYRPVAQWTSEASLPSDQQPNAADKPGRVFESVGRHRHATETVPPREAIRHAFGRTLAQALNKARADGAFESLVLYAAPKFLHDLRQHLDKPTTQAVVHSEAKDLTSLPEAELFEAFDALPTMLGPR